MEKTMPAFLKSKTIWTQIIGFGAMALAMFGIDFPVEDQATVAASIMGVVNVVSMIVRYFTSEPMSAK